MVNAEREIVVLTGASGCIGFHTLSLLIEQDERVSEIRCLDLRQPDEKMRKLIEAKLNEHNDKVSSFNERLVDHAELSSRKNRKKQVIWCEGDIRDINLVEQLLRGADCIIHAAARVEAWTHWTDQNVAELYSVNVEGTQNLLKTAQRLGVYKFIHVSSFETYIGYDTIYYATENTLPEFKTFLFGASGSSKWEAENKVRQYANMKLNQSESSEEHQYEAKKKGDQDGVSQDSTIPDQQLARNENRKPDQLLAVIIRFSTVYGEFDNHYISKIMRMTKFFNGKLQRMSNVWIKQQSIYARNAAWSLVKAKQRLDVDQSISGEEFHITDDTDIEDPFDFVAPYLESRGMQVTKDSYSFIPIWCLVWLLFSFAVFLRRFDVFGLFSLRKSRYQEAIEKDKAANNQADRHDGSSNLAQNEQQRWYHYVMPQTLFFMCNSSFLNRTKASLRLDYEPIDTPEEAQRRSLDWYKNELVL